MRVWSFWNANCPSRIETFGTRSQHNSGVSGRRTDLAGLKLMEPVHGMSHERKLRLAVWLVPYPALLQYQELVS
jgi:hypothetical protein